MLDKSLLENNHEKPLRSLFDFANRYWRLDCYVNSFMGAQMNVYSFPAKFDSWEAAQADARKMSLRLAKAYAERSFDFILVGDSEQARSSLAVTLLEIEKLLENTCA